MLLTKSFNEQNLEIAGRTKNYFFGEGNNIQEKITNLVLADIENYRMNRRKLFSEIKISEK